MTPRFRIKRLRKQLLGLPSKSTIILVTAFWNAFITVHFKSSLLRRRFRAELERRITVRYKDAVVGEYDADLIVEDCVLIEVKIAPQYDKRDEAQLLQRAQSYWYKTRPTR